MGSCLSRQEVFEDYTQHQQHDTTVIIKKSSSVDKTITQNFSLQLANSSSTSSSPPAKNKTPPPPATHSQLQNYMRNASENCTDLPTTQRDDKHSTVHALSSKSYFNKCKAFFPADVRVFSIASRNLKGSTECDVRSGQDERIPALTVDNDCVASSDIVPAFLAVLYNNRRKALSFDQVVNSMQELIQPQQMMEEQRPSYRYAENSRYDDKQNVVKLTSSNPELDVAFHIVRPAGQGARRAILAGENNDNLCNLLTYLVEIQKFAVENVVVLRDETDEKVKEHMLALVERSRSGDSVFFYYSSSGKIKREKKADDESRSNSIMPLSNGNEIIREKDLAAGFLGPLPGDVTVTCLIDRPNMTVDLPYAYKATEQNPCNALSKMTNNDEFSFLRFVDFLRETCEGLGSNLMFIELARNFAKVVDAANENLAAQKLLFEF
eukprot:CAMPEP_0196823214 /NCGR_PEP_ID=MMETSP1362-20130617/86555_1 /TAXON_ID=163516 /ORGANISM="Leptocylindrus danicus, Strain CCMP1856" /LENGTH=436 /DNA_ID=CAMNT_0042203015 /DNA_START=369 /DNA_END=1679 /DNA_ORIENTATION=+